MRQRLLFSAVFPLLLPLLSEAAIDLSKIRLPEGFKISLYAKQVPGARSMARGPGGTLFVGTRDQGNVMAVVDKNGDQVADEVITIARGLRMPNGVAFRDGALYVAEVNRILRYDGIESHLKDVPKPVVVRDDLPRDSHHGWKYLAFGPDGFLYVPVGAPCNICNPSDQRYASILRVKPDGSSLEVFAKGIRNTVGFDWNPSTRELWFTDNGRDNLGENIPPDELNRAPKAGMHFGYPFCHAAGIKDPDFGQNANCSEYTPPARELGPHVASLGLKFYTGSLFHEKYRHQIFIAEHGSWNRKSPLGYRVSVATLNKEGAVTGYDIFAEGWLDSSGTSWGRPVDVLVMPDGALLISDDQAGVIYRISYEKRQS